MPWQQPSSGSADQLGPNIVAIDAHRRNDLLGLLALRPRLVGRLQVAFEEAQGRRGEVGGRAMGRGTTRSPDRITWR
ncbi:MAG: hypothetical protein M3406_10935 [Chloroflexota bacterium]|nr:hypothetical protein [Chloroflexota bacterium]